MKIYHFLLLIPIFSCSIQAMQQLPLLVRIPQSVTIPTRWHKIHVPSKVKVHALNHILRIEHLLLDRLILEHDLCVIESRLIWPEASSLTRIQFPEELYNNILFPWFEYSAARFAPLVNALKKKNNRIEFIDEKTNVVYAWTAPQFPLHIVHKALKMYSNQNQKIAETMYAPWDVTHVEHRVYQVLIDNVEACAGYYYDNATTHISKKSSTHENCLATCAKYYAKQAELVRLKAAIHTSEVQLLALIKHNKDSNDEEL